MSKDKGHGPQWNEITQRSYFAAAALTGLISRMSNDDYQNQSESSDWNLLCLEAFEIADDMLSASLETGQ